MKIPDFSRRSMMLALGGAAILPARTVAAPKSSITAKMVLEDNRLWVAATIGASEPLLFIVDTGAGSNFIRPDLADRLRLSVVDGGRIVGGVGNKRAVTATVEARDVQLAGAMRQSRMTFTTYDFGRGLAPDAAGLFAAGLLTAYDSDLVFSGNEATWRIWPDGRDAPPFGTHVEASSITRRGARAGSERIYVTAMLDGKSYRLMVDTGAPSSLLLFPRAVARSGLWASPRYAPRATRGFGGEANRLSRLVRATRLEFGALRLKAPFVTLMDPGQSSSFDVDGVLGLPLISLFDLSTDVGAGRVWVQRNGRAPTADRYGRSGLWFDRTTTGGAAIRAVGGGSPAETAGLRAGDVIATPARFETAQRLIDGPAGTVIDLGIMRDGATVPQRLTLTDYL